MRQSIVVPVMVLPLLISLVCGGDDELQLNDDVLGLIVFKSDHHDPFSHLASWNEDDASPCSWTFVSCNRSAAGVDRVSELALDGLGLSGRLRLRGLLKLQNLKVLSLSGNNLTGEVPPELSLVGGGALRTLNLSRNALYGRLPDSPVGSIRFLDLSQNSLSGPLPDPLFSNSSSSLRFLSLAGNLLEGPVPVGLYSCHSLSGLDLSSNRFSGNPVFAGGIWNLTRLRGLDLSRNAFTGPVSDGVRAVHFLKKINLRGNQFSGPLPADIGHCPHLKFLDFGDNLFTGDLPESLQSLRTSLRFLGLYNNRFDVNFPHWIANITGLEHIDFADNGFTGTLPPAIGDLRFLKFMSFSDNELVGEVPTSMVHCTDLSVVRLRGNGFNGNIPSGLFDLGLEELDLSNNELSGSIPPGSTRLFESLIKLDLAGNKLTGHIPPEMGLFSNLKYLNLSWNNLRSMMPPEFGYLPGLSVLDLRKNDLFGPIPEDLCESGALSILQLDGNSLMGPIPAEMGNCTSLYLLSLSHNNLNGSIPESISMLSKLRILKLEFNRLGGELPQELDRLENLLVVNISHNRLVGRLPTGGIFSNLDQSALEGNLGLCSPLLKGPCQMNVPKPLVLDPSVFGSQINGHNNQTPNNTKHGHSQFFGISVIIAISAAILIVLGVMVVTLLSVSARRQLEFAGNASDSMYSGSSRSDPMPSMGRLVLFDSKSSQDRNDSEISLLDNAAEIGRGAFGTVYKASFGTIGEFAMKKLIPSNILQYPDDFDREVRILGKARHPNLVALRGYRWTPQMQLLITDYETNGSLQAKLHERPASEPPLSWANRFKIVVGIAKGLAHLHHSQPPITHYTMKPSNVLLDEHYNPKISDFGLARVIMKRGLTNPFQSSVGYAAPELAWQGFKADEKCDVYGFGMIVLELVTGRRAVEYGEDSIVMLGDHVRVVLEKGNFLECVDPNMEEHPEEEVLPVLKLGVVCISQMPSSRPSMAEVVQILQVIKTPVQVQRRMEIF